MTPWRLMRWKYLQDTTGKGFIFRTYRQLQEINTKKNGKGYEYAFIPLKKCNCLTKIQKAQHHRYPKKYQKIFENNPHILKCMWHQLCNVPDSTPIPFISEWQNQDIHLHESESRSVVSDPLWPHGLYGIIQVRILEWVAIPFSRGSSQPSNWTLVSCIAGGLFTSWATREAHTRAQHSPK